MTELKGVDKLNKDITNVLNNGLHTDLEYILGTDFCYYTESEQIQFAVLMMSKSDTYWRKFIEQRFGLSLNERDMWIFSILHEIGHNRTLDNVDDYNYNKARFIKWLIEKPFIGGTKFANMVYFGLADEIIATAWAVHFFKKHKKLCRNTSEKAFILIKNFLDDNGVSE